MVWWEPVLSFAAGSLLGVFFFGGLWWTVQRLPHAGSPALLALVSFILRTAAVMGVFYLILTGFSGTGWLRLLAGLAGFILARVVIVLRIRPRGQRAADHQSKTRPKERG